MIPFPTGFRHVEGTSIAQDSSSPAARRVLGSLALALGCWAAAALFCMPLVLHPSDLLTSARMEGDLPDTLLTQWLWGRALGAGGGLPDVPLAFFPDGISLLRQAWNPVTLSLGGWLHAFLGPVAAYNHSVVLLAALNALGCFLLGVRLGGRWAGLAAAATGLALPAVWFELFEGRQEAVFLAPAALFVRALVDLADDRPRAWLWTGLSMGLVAVTYWFTPPFLALCAAPVLGRTLFRRGVALRLGGALLVCLAVSAPFALAVAPRLAAEPGATVGAALQDGLFMQALNAVAPPDLLLGRDVAAYRLPVGVLVALALAFGHRSSRRWGWMALIALLLSLGPYLRWRSTGGFTAAQAATAVPLPLYLLDLVPPFQRFWWPGRLLVLAGLAAAAAAASLVALLPGRVRPWVAVLAAAAVLADGRLATMEAVARGDHRIRPSPMDPQREGSFYAVAVPRWIQDGPDGGAALHAPLRLAPSTPNLPLMTHLAAVHGLPMVTGDGAVDAATRPAAFQARIAANPLLAAWADGSWASLDLAGGARDLAATGVRWLLWNLPDPSLHPQENRAWRDAAAPVERHLGPPSHQEGTLLVWDLAKAGGPR